ncbi:MAG: DUF4065 domain-containing protein [Bryobacterales bacterium]|nr:DUF4065 domain-containing protein [Bryobacterales bacterium]
MSRRINFDFDVSKFVNASAYLVERCPEVTKMKLAKLLYFADKAHLLVYGRPVIGDRYIKMEYGPVPSCGYNLIKRDERASREDQSLFDHYMDVNGNDITLKASANLNHLSETDREVLDDVAARYGSLTPAQLSKLSHREPAWQNAEMNSEMDYRLLFANNAESKDVHLLVEQDQELKEALSELELDEFLASLQS